jgi:hypothetical protein
MAFFAMDQPFEDLEVRETRAWHCAGTHFAS